MLESKNRHVDMTPSREHDRTWWKESVVYQIYPRSFNDSNGDGIGDFNGIIEKLDHIKSLGVDVIWICPVYMSPNDDNGYDISDYRRFLPEFGTEEEFSALLDGIHARGMKLIMDLVPNHTSDEHAWFEASRSSKDNPYRDYYIWRPGKNDGPPNNWKSIFGGSAWQYDEVTREYYLHLFTRKQPDLNWENPKVRKEIQDVVRYWLDKGIDGFRMDVVSLISKRPGLPDSHTDDFNVMFKEYYANGPRVHEFLRELHQEVLQHYDIMTVGEGPGIDLDNALDYVGKDRQELQMVFHFGHMFLDCGPGGKYDPIPVSLPQFKQVFGEWDEKLKGKGWGSVFLGNHDFSRMVSRFGDDGAFHKESAKLLCTLLLTMRGTPFIYQGDEIGMTNVAYDSIEDYDDVETLNNWKEAQEAGKDMDQFMKLVHDISRDNARTPVQWTEGANGGFSSGTPWIKVNPNFVHINVASNEGDDDSILNYYREMVAFRKANDVFVYGEYECLNPEHPSLYAYRRWDDKSEFLVLLNFSDETQLWQGAGDESSYYLAKTNMVNNGTLFELAPWQAKVLQRIGE